MRSEICILRHGITTGNVSHLYYGSTDVPLADVGMAELEKLAAEGVYPNSEGAEFYTTGMLRTEQTLDIVYGAAEHGVIPELRELDFGDFEMKHYSEIENDPEYKKWINAEDGGTPPPNGESFEHFIERIEKGFEILKNHNAMRCFQLRHKRKLPMTICICHGGSISVIMNSIWPEKHKNFYEWIPDPGHGYRLILEDCKIVNAEPF